VPSIRLLFKLALVVVLVAAVAALTSLVRRPRKGQSVTLDTWPSVPRKPDVAA
jgi:hypothetical protein